MRFKKELCIFIQHILFLFDFFHGKNAGNGEYKGLATGPIFIHAVYFFIFSIFYFSFFPFFIYFYSLPLIFILFFCWKSPGNPEICGVAKNVFLFISFYFFIFYFFIFVFPFPLYLHRRTKKNFGETGKNEEEENKKKKIKNGKNEPCRPR
jgi:hypothetical protein